MVLQLRPLLPALLLAAAPAYAESTQAVPQASRTQSAATADACLAEVEKLMRDTDTLEARFQMQKKAPGIKRLLVSRGRVVVSPGRGLIWKVDFPYEALSVFGPGKIGRTDEAGNYSVREVPQAAQAIEVASRFDRAAVARDFFISCTKKNARLMAVLTPKNSTYANFLSEAVVELDAAKGVLTRLSLSQPSGAVSHISFSEQTKSPRPSGNDGELLQSVQ